MDDNDKQLIISTLNIIKDEAGYIQRKCGAIESYVKNLKTN